MKRKKNCIISLPISRKDAFIQTYKNNFLFLIKLSLLVSIFIIPLIGFVVASSLLEGGIIYANNGDELAQWLALLKFRRVFSWAFVPCIIILAFGVVGGLYVCKRSVENDGVILVQDFFLGIKNNFKRTLFLGLFYSLLIVVIRFANYLIEDTTMFFSFFCFAVIIQLILSISFLYSLSLSFSYETKFFESISKGLLFTFMELGNNLLMVLITFGPLLVASILNLILPSLTLVIYIMFVLYIILGLGHSMLVISLMQHHVFDKRINKFYFKDHYHKGLFDGEQSE